jgi:hypothetical protein
MPEVPRRVRRLIGVYDADGGVVGEVRYALGRIRGHHCSLCDLTHRGVSRRPEWEAACETLSVPIVLLHRNERDAQVTAASDGHVPCVLAEVDEELVVVLEPAALTACGTDVDEFARRLHTALDALRLVLA